MTGAGEFATRTTPVIATAKTMMNLNVDSSAEASRKAAPRRAAQRPGAIMVKIDGAIAAAANVQFEIVNLGHGFLRSSIAGFATMWAEDAGGAPLRLCETLDLSLR